MGQLNKQHKDLPKSLKTVGKKKLQSCYSSEELISLALNN
jgi:hypothetical protein